MSEVSLLIESFGSKIKLIEQSIANAAAQVKQWTDNHNGLVGMLQATKDALDEANKVIGYVAPNSAVADTLNALDNAANVIEEAAHAANPENP